jgi:hypothetical protein
MYTPHPVGFTAAEVWEIVIHVGPILVAVVLATLKLTKVIRDEIRGEIGPIITRIDRMEESFKAMLRELWDHNETQDLRIDAVTASHNRLRGSHDAIIRIGHASYSGPERRKEDRPPECKGPG